MTEQEKSILLHSALEVKLVGALFKYQRRTKRKFSVWVARDEPDYFTLRFRDIRFGKKLGSGKDNIDNQNSLFKRMQRKESEYWIEQISAIDGVEASVVYANTGHLHITVKLYGTVFDNVIALLPSRSGEDPYTTDWEKRWYKKQGHNARQFGEPSSTLLTENPECAWEYPRSEQEESYRQIVKECKKKQNESGQSD